MLLFLAHGDIVYCRISQPCFLAECCKKRLNQDSFVLLCFALFAFSVLCLVCVLSVFLICPLSCIVGCESTWMALYGLILCWCGIKDLLPYSLMSSSFVNDSVTCVQLWAMHSHVIDGLWYDCVLCLLCHYCIFSLNCVISVFLQYFDTVGWVLWPVKPLAV